MAQKIIENDFKLAANEYSGIRCLKENTATRRLTRTPVTAPDTVTATSVLSPALIPQKTRTAGISIIINKNIGVLYHTRQVLTRINRKIINELPAEKTVPLDTHTFLQYNN